MALTPTTDKALGFIAPEFNLLDVVSGKEISSNELIGDKATVVMFICNHCPFVIHVKHELVHLANDYIDKGISFIAISSNDVVNYPQDSPQKMKELALELNFPFPYLYDETQEVAKAYDAACTPDFSIFDKNKKCVYRGQLDGSRPGNNIPVSGKSIREALDAILNDKILDPALQKLSVGCGIKWK